MSQQKEDERTNEAMDSEEKDNNQDQNAEEAVVSDDDVIDYSVKPEFYDPNLDDKDQLWIQKKRKGQYSDAVLSCPACFTTLCLECQRHEKYVTQYRAIFVVNCKIKKGEVSDKGSLKRKRFKKGVGSADGESYTPVGCSVCDTEVGVIDDEEVYHFYNVLPSEC
ncbi:E2F-associated phosphoprotein [Artemisia annua]|uniref:E2F-associated phosphoprotein n=1 Tax=Artemisia annua TaxID=35608 RepID=A0A2U1LET9_ARTAN|nr:E2F-associated phosphoprotein [Artemisia annua]